MLQGEQSGKQDGPIRHWKVAIVGKGGSGKTMLAAQMARILARNASLRTLVIDADSAVGLPYALGMQVPGTVADIRRQIIEDPGARSEMANKHVRDVVAGCLVPGRGFDLLVMGRPEGPGCYCSVNDLLRYGIERLSQEFDITIVDCEAGPEQVNRRVIRAVDTVIIVTDGSLRGMQVARVIRQVVQGDEGMRSAQVRLVINRQRGEQKAIAETARDAGLEVLGFIPEDDTLLEYDSLGKPITDLLDTAPSAVAVGAIMQRLRP
jgi:CO dehydrogenase maturation factor